jgi:hypothetical protein
MPYSPNVVLNLLKSSNWISSKLFPHSVWPEFLILIAIGVAFLSQSAANAIGSRDPASKSLFSGSLSNVKSRIFQPAITPSSAFNMKLAVVIMAERRISALAAPSLFRSCINCPLYEYENSHWESNLDSPLIEFAAAKHANSEMTLATAILKLFIGNNQLQIEVSPKWSQIIGLRLSCRCRSMSSLN